MLLAEVEISTTILENILATCSKVEGVPAALQGVPFLGLSPRETLTCMHRETCIRMFFATLYIIGRH